MIAKPDNFTIPPVVLVVWRDAISYQADDKPNPPVVPSLATLVEVGFLLGEDVDCVVIGMEVGTDEGDVTPGRWRLHVPKAQIQSIELLTKKPAPRRRKPTPAVIDATALKEEPSA